MPDLYEQIFFLAGRTLAITVAGWLGIRLALTAGGFELFGEGAAWQFFIVWILAIVSEYTLRSEGEALVHALAFSLLAVGLLASLTATVARAIKRRRGMK